jgi:hypothetical protein
MPSSKADPSATLEEIGAAYEAALQSLIEGRLEDVAEQLASNEERLQRPCAEPDRTDERFLTARDRALHAHQQLMAVMSTLHQETQRELARTRQARKAMKGYGSRGDSLGEKVRSRA